MKSSQDMRRGFVRAQDKREGKTRDGGKVSGRVLIARMIGLGSDSSRCVFALFKFHLTSTTHRARSISLFFAFFLRLFRFSFSRVFFIFHLFRRLNIYYPIPCSLSFLSSLGKDWAARDSAVGQRQGRLIKRRHRDVFIDSVGKLRRGNHLRCSHREAASASGLWLSSHDSFPFASPFIILAFVRHSAGLS